MKCDNCGIKCETLSRLNTCPDCVAKWVKEYSDLHKRNRND